MTSNVRHGYASIYVTSTFLHWKFTRLGDVADEFYICLSAPCDFSVEEVSQYTTVIASST